MTGAVEAFLYPRGRPGPTVHVWCTRKSIPSDVRECIDGRYPLIHNAGDPWNWPKHCDFYVMRSQLNWQSEKAAAALQAQIVVLPEQTDWLRNQINQRIKAGNDVYIFRASRVGDRP